MNHPHDPNATAARPPDAGTPSTVSSAAVDSHDTVDRYSASTERTRPDGGAANDLPVIPSYRVLREIARGGMGRVLAAHDLILDREVAVKLLLPGANPDRFVRESKITARLPHPGIPPIHALGTLPDGSPFLAMKLVDGKTLSAELKTADRRRRLQIFTQVCQAVGFAHSRGVIHRDLKPGNVMVGAFGEVQVMDWGLAKELAPGGRPQPDDMLPLPPGTDDPDHTVTRPVADESTEEQTAAGTVLGTPAYMAPEQARGEAVTPAADVYGLGAILYALLAGRAPYTGANVADVLKQVATTDPPLFTRGDRNVPPALVAICRKAMARTPADRYPTAEAVAADVQNWLTGEPVSAYRERWTDRVSRWARRRRTGVITAAGVLVALTAASVVAAVLLWQEQNQTKRESDRAEDTADDAIRLVHDLSGYVNKAELAGSRQSLTDQQRKNTLDQALQGYERLLARRPNDEELRAAQAHTHRSRANVCRVLGENAEAERSYREATGGYSELISRNPNSVGYRTDLLETTRDFSILVKALGRLRESGEILDSTISQAEGLLDTDPQSQEKQRRLAMLLLDRAELDYQLGRFADAEQNARRTVNMFARLAAQPDPPHPLDPLFYGMGEIRLAVALRELGRLEEALTVHDQVVKRFTPYLGLVSDNTRTYTFEYHRAQAERALTLAQLPGREAEVSAAFDSAIVGCEKLVTQYPKFPPYQRNWAAYLLFRGRWNAKAGRPIPAAVDLKSAAGRFETLAQQFPDAPVYCSFLGQTYAVLGGIEADKVKRAEYVRKARERLEEVLRVTPESALERKVLSGLDSKTNDLNR